jgi:hypothetical protein
MRKEAIMATEPNPLGRLLKDYLFLLDKKETHLAEAIGLSPNKVSAAIHGRYRLKRDHFDSIVTTLADWKIRLTEKDHAELLDAWRSSTIQRPAFANTVQPGKWSIGGLLAAVLIMYAGLSPHAPSASQAPWAYAVEEYPPHTTQFQLADAARRFLAWWATLYDATSINVEYEQLLTAISAQPLRLPAGRQPLLLMAPRGAGQADAKTLSV